MNKQTQTKKFICEALIGSSKSTAIRKWIASNSTEKFMPIVPTVNTAEEFYTKLCNMNKELNIRLCVNDNAFTEFHKAVYNGINIIITTYHTTFKCIGDMVEEFYIRQQRLDNFFVIDEAHILLDSIIDVSFIIAP